MPFPISPFSKEFSMTLRRWFDLVLLAWLLASTGMLRVAWTASGPCYQNNMASAQTIGCQDDPHINTLVMGCGQSCYPGPGSGYCDNAQVDSPNTIPRGAYLVSAGGNTGLQYVGYFCWSHTPCNCQLQGLLGCMCSAGKTTQGPNTWNPQSVNPGSPGC